MISWDEVTPALNVMVRIWRIVNIDDNVLICGELSDPDIINSVLTDSDPSDKEEEDDEGANMISEPVVILKEDRGAIYVRGVLKK